MAELTAADVALHARRQKAFVLMVRSRVLCLRVGEACRRSSWLKARARYLMKGRERRLTDRTGAPSVVAIRSAAR